MNLDNDDSDDDDDETNSNRGGSNTIRFDSVQKLNKNFEFNEDNNPLNNSSIIPSEYLNDDISNLPYNLKINELPQCSRVETQIKIQLSISPPPPQFLLHIPKDTISKPKLSLNGPIPDSIKNHLLYLDSFVVPSSMLDDTDSLVSSPNSPSSNTNNNTNSNKLRSCNICKRCMRRELKRASRRKATNSNDSNKWSLDSPKRAIIYRIII
ncbi:unnamed protein product [[Candida] boidinii]|nr:unnamed protein product [[Candida] boidinii]